MKPWQLGNTSVRSGLRTRDALVALAGSDLQGNIRGHDGDKAFRELLGTAGVVSLSLDTTVSVGRKFRHALNRLGLIYPEAPSGVSQADIGPVDHLTPAGVRFIEAQSVRAQQECFLRAISGISFESAGDRWVEAGTFSPLLHVLRFMAAMNKATGNSRMTHFELSAFVQLSDIRTSMDSLVETVIRYRANRAAAANKKQHDGEVMSREAKRSGVPLKIESYNDYGDMNLRWLKGTGLFSQSGHGIEISKHQREMADAITKKLSPISDRVTYWRNLTEGPALPSDNDDVARDLLDDLMARARVRNIDVSAGAKSVEMAADIAVVRYDLEEAIAAVDEVEFARRQAIDWREISSYLKAFTTGRARVTANGDDDPILIPRGESPGYLEWAVWRAFLAINRIKNPPSRSRRFHVDSDFLPVGNAPGGGPDLVFEFEDFVLVVEVTLLTSGRQEAAEGYPVRQHVYSVTREYGANVRFPVYGLFVAPRMDQNTLATFRRAEFHADEAEHRLPIVPITIEQFERIFVAMFDTGRVDVMRVKQLLERCLNIRDSVAGPNEWAGRIDGLIDESIQELTTAS